MKTYSRKKTEEEGKGDLKLTRISDLQPVDREKWWNCDQCKTIFTGDDFILYRVYKSGQDFKCPLLLGFFQNPCGQRLTCANEDYWNENVVFDL